MKLHKENHAEAFSVFREHISLVEQIRHDIRIALSDPARKEENVEHVSNLEDDLDTVARFSFLSDRDVLEWLIKLLNVWLATTSFADSGTPFSNDELELLNKAFLLGASAGALSPVNWLVRVKHETSACKWEETYFCVAPNQVEAERLVLLQREDCEIVSTKRIPTTATTPCFLISADL